MNLWKWSCKTDKCKRQVNICMFNSVKHLVPIEYQKPQNVLTPTTKVSLHSYHLKPVKFITACNKLCAKLMLRLVNMTQNPDFTGITYIVGTLLNYHDNKKIFYVSLNRGFNGILNYNITWKKQWRSFIQTRVCTWSLWVTTAIQEVLGHSNKTPSFSMQSLIEVSYTIF